MLAEQPEATRKLRALWALYAVGGLDEAALLALLDSPEETVRVWSVRLLLEDKKASPAVLSKFTNLAKADKSPAVRLALASGLQRLPTADRWAVAEALGSHAEDAADANLPLMLWYGVEPLAAADASRAAELLAKCRIPLVRQYLARRIAAAAG
jgi:hypothetical protein